MGAAVIHLSATLETLTCGECGIHFAAPDNWIAHRRKTKENWYCPNGHVRVFVGETEAQKLQRQLDFERQRRESAERDRNTARKAEAIVRGKLKATQERVGNGVCPCCKRSFTNLRRHMGTKHPEYKHGERE